MNSKVARYRTASLAYLVYGILYLSFAVARVSPARLEQSTAGIPGWVFYLLGVLVLVVFPCLIWRQWKWFTRVIALGPLAKAFRLLSIEADAIRGGVEPDWQRVLFACVALIASGVLIYASWRGEPPSTEDVPQSSQLDRGI